MPTTAPVLTLLTLPAANNATKYPTRMRADGDDGAMETRGNDDFLDKRPHRPFPGIYQGQSKSRHHQNTNLRGGQCKLQVAKQKNMPLQDIQCCSFTAKCTQFTVLYCTVLSVLECTILQCTLRQHMHACNCSGIPLCACFS